MFRSQKVYYLAVNPEYLPNINQDSSMSIDFDTIDINATDITTIDINTP